jgi:hypothetical protein
MRTVNRALIAGVGVVAAIAVSANPSAASPIAYNQKVQYLTDNPTPSMGVSVVDRKIILAQGTYTWGLLLDGTVPGSTWKRSIFLKAGTYDWTDILIPDNGYYDQQSSLSDDQGDPVAYLASPTFVDTSGTHEWGSELIPPK